MNKMGCSNCGKDARVIRGSYPFKEIGLRNVVLKGIQIAKCSHCGNEDPLLPRMNHLMKVLTQAVLRKPSSLSGEEVRFLRHYLRMTGEQFARLLHVDRTTLSKWENGEDRVGGQSDLLIRMVVVSLGEGLRDQLDNVVRNLAQVRRSRRHMRIDLKPETMEYQYT